MARKTGILWLLGISGVGKTTLIKRHILKNVSHSDVVLEDLNVCAGAHLSIAKADYVGSALEAALTRQYSGKKSVYVLDHVDQFDDDLLAKILAAISVRNQHKQPTLLVLAGLPDLEKRFKAPCFEVFKHHFAESFTLPHLNVTTVREYINYRLRFIGYSGKPLFSKAAIRKIAKLSKGAPRMINTLCGNCLFQARMAQKPVISEEIVNQAGEIFSWGEGDVFEEENLSEAVTSPNQELIQPVFVSNAAESADVGTQQSSSQYIDQSLQEIQQMLVNISHDEYLTQQPLKEPAKPKPIIQSTKNDLKSDVSSDLISRSQTKKPVIPDKQGSLLKRRANENVVAEPVSAFAPAATVEDRVKAKFTPRPKPAIPASSVIKSKFSSSFYKAGALAATMLLATVGVYWIVKAQLLGEISPQITMDNTAATQIEAINREKKGVSIPAIQAAFKENVVVGAHHVAGDQLNTIFIPKHKPPVKLVTIAPENKRNEGVDGKIRAAPPKEKVVTSSQVQNKSDALELAAKARAAARYELTQQGVSYDKQDFLASAAKGNNARLKLFLNANMPVDIQGDMSRNTALINAVKSGKLSTVQLILSRKPSVNQKNGLGKTALMLAVERRQVGIVKALLKNGANPHIRDISGQTARSIAQRHNDTQILSLFD